MNELKDRHLLHDEPRLRKWIWMKTENDYTLHTLLVPIFHGRCLDIRCKYDSKSCLRKYPTPCVSVCLVNVVNPPLRVVILLMTRKDNTTRFIEFGLVSSSSPYVWQPRTHCNSWYFLNSDARLCPFRYFRGRCWSSSSDLGVCCLCL